MDGVGTMLDVTLVGALLAGLLSFLSPCVIPIVPFYLGYLAGAGANLVTAGVEITPAVRRRTILVAVLFALGVITVFMGLGAAATAFGQLVREYFDVLRWAAAGVIIVMGLHFLGVVRIGLLFRQFGAAGGSGKAGLPGAYVIWLAFAFGWTPCVGPVLAAILFIAAGQDTAFEGAALLFVYGSGMTAPFVLAALFIGPFMHWMAGFRRHLPVIERLTGGLLVLFGVLIATDTVNLIALWMLENLPWFATIG